MSSQDNLQIAQSFLDGLKNGDLEASGLSLAGDLSFEIQGDDGVLPWIGHKIGRRAMIDMLRDQHEMIEVQALEVEDMLASESRAVIVGSMRTLIKATGKVTNGSFAIVLTMKDGVITRYQLIENSFDVARAAR